jgi:ATP-binding cassette subfamily B protein
MTDPDDADLEALPSGVTSLARNLRLGRRLEPVLLPLSLGLVVAGVVPDALAALWIGMLARALRPGEGVDHGLLATAVVGLGVSAVGTWVIRNGGDRLHQRFRMRLAVGLETHVARLQATAPGIEHHERPAVLDRLAMLRDQVFTLDHVYLSVFGLFGAAVRLLVVLALLAVVHPALIALGLAAVPPMIVAQWRRRAEVDVWEAHASHRRLARHLFVLGTDAATAKELRVNGNAASVARARQAAWNRFEQAMAPVRWRSALAAAAAWAVFAAAFVAAVAVVANGDGPDAAADALIVLAAGARLAAYVGMAATELDHLGFFLEGSRRLAWLEDFVAARQASAPDPAPEALRRGIDLEDVTFCYPGSSRPVLEHVDLHLPAGAVVAVVGENGAGKSTLVKLLAKLYAPSGGRITVDGHDLATVDTAAWRERTAGAFQDHHRFELPAQGSVGVGDLPRIDDEPAVTEALGRAGAHDVVERLPEGLGTQLGPAWPGGVDLSGGQWQKVALARGLVRDEPLLVVLDEPTSALDAETEHALFERFAAQARAAATNGRVTVLVSHRFSTVRMADLVVVLSGARVVEVGTHADLVGRGGTYAELYAIQAAAYR